MFYDKNVFAGVKTLENVLHGSLLVVIKAI